jgi:hypothetical protein
VVEAVAVRADDNGVTLDAVDRSIAEILVTVVDVTRVPVKRPRGVVASGGR